MYFYHAYAVALGGVIERPVRQTIAALASCSLPVTGGTSSAKEGKFDNGLVSFDSAQSDLTGSIEMRDGKVVYVTGVSVAVYGLNVRNMVRADQIVLRLAAEHETPPAPITRQRNPDWGEARITTTGCHFDNLKIAGHAVSVETNHTIFSDYPTYGDFQAAWRGDRTRIQSCLLGSTLKSSSKNDPASLQHAWLLYQEQANLPDLKHKVLCSFVKAVNGINGAEIGNHSQIIVIPQFGTIVLGEVIVSPNSRRVNMLRLALGLDASGDLVGGDAGIGPAEGSELGTALFEPAGAGSRTWPFGGSPKGSSRVQKPRAFRCYGGRT